MVNEEENYAVTHGAAIVPDDLAPKEWPINNKVGSCLCGHEEIDHHHPILPESIDCTQCQCKSFALDTWGTLQ